MIERFGHGGDLETATATFGVRREQWVDFSANINPLGPPQQVWSRIQQEWEQIVHYPDPDHRQFRQLLAASLAVSEEQLCIGNGAAECMALALLAFSPQRVGVVYPCFSEYISLSRQFGAEVIGIYGEAEQHFRASTEALKSLIRQVDLVFLGQPNNPTGVQYEVAVLRELAAEAELSNTVLVLDEAFIDFMAPAEQMTLLGELAACKQVLLIRSMTKFYAIPGLRLGYAIARPDWIAGMKSKQVTWSVNRLALAAGEAVMSDCEEYETLTREQTAMERAFLIHALEEQFGCQTWPSLANFMLVRLPAPWTAASLQTKLGERGILIRSCAMYEGLTERDIRLAVKSHAQNELLIRHMTELWHEER